MTWPHSTIFLYVNTQVKLDWILVLLNGDSSMRGYIKKRFDATRGGGTDLGVVLCMDVDGCVLSGIFCFECDTVATSNHPPPLTLTAACIFDIFTMPSDPLSEIGALAKGRGYTFAIADDAHVVCTDPSHSTLPIMRGIMESWRNQ